MHELSVTESILEIVCRHAEQANARRVVRIRLVIGDLSSIVDDSVQFYFDFLSRDSVAQGAQLVFERRPVRLRCPHCDYGWQPTDADWACPSCGRIGARIESGREFYVDSIEVE